MSDQTEPEQKQRVNPPNQFQPGQSGNPAGRPPGSKSFTTKVKEALLKIADGKDFTYEEALVKKIMHKAIVEGNEQMIKLMWNYIDGMPQQSMDLTSLGKSLTEVDPERQKVIDKALLNHLNGNKRHTTRK